MRQDKYKYLDAESSSPPSEAAVDYLMLGESVLMWWGLMRVEVGVAAV